MDLIKEARSLVLHLIFIKHLRVYSVLSHVK